MVTISHSEVESFLLCPRKHYYGYGAEIQRIKESDALERGNIGHAAAAAYFDVILNGGDSPLAAAKQSLLGSLTPTNGDIIDGLAKTFELLHKAMPFAGYEILAVEKEFVLPLSDDVSYPFVVDLIVKDPRGRIAVVDHKFIYDFMRPMTMQILPQIPKYIGALRVLGFPVEYGMYHELRYRKLKDPSPEDVVRLTPMVTNDARIQQVFNEQIAITNIVVERKLLPLAEQSRMAHRVANKMVCDKCSFLAICTAELNQEDIELTLRSEYKKRERRNFSKEGGTDE